MAPLAGRPPFATDEPDSVFQSPQPRTKAPQQQQPANRNSSYDVYDNYLSPGEGAANRNSGIDALGMGFMNANMDDSDDSDDEDDMRRARNASNPASPSKNAALAAATGAKNVSSKGPFAPERLETPPPQYNNNSPQRSSPLNTPSRSPSSPSPIAQPRPGYAAPIAALNQSAGAPARPEPAVSPAGRSGPGSNLRIVPQPHSPGYGTPSPSGSPHPLQAPITPITPVFARPQRSATMDSDKASVAFSDKQGLIMRGEGEETLLSRGRGEKGEQFWRRFSMVAKDPEERRPSSWLQKTQGGASRLNRWVWIVGIILIICAAGGIGIGVYLSEKASSHYRPDAIGGSANDGTSALPATNSTTKSAGKAALGTATTTVEHVSPTNTVARREAPAFTVAAGHAVRNGRHTAHLGL
ncbi:hypothetical protein B0H16DRAFT_295278 [Mycena metata]|uniref:Uncharacterized protein n=1 Tax=Mycena metata TaxID=1033252 RepID=A0AAD7KJA9_9AGAR|nr:hypothetical protein B0H16DRAFT_295278 [Mycena metata]